MAKQDRSVWFDSINHLPLKPISSTTEHSNKEQATPNQSERPTPNLAQVQASESKESQKEVLPIEPPNNKQLSEGKSLPEEAIINKETPTPSTKIKKGVKKVTPISEPSARQPIVSPNDLPLDTGSPNTDPSDIVHIAEEEKNPPKQDLPIVDKQLDDHQETPLSNETLSDNNSATDSIQKTGSTRRKRAAKNSNKSTTRKKSKKESSSKKKKYITSRMIKETYKEMISEYPLMSRTELVDSIVKFFLEHPKRQRDQWLNEQCGGTDKY